MSCFIINQEMFQTCSAVYCSNTRNPYPHHSQIARVSCFQKSTYNAGVRAFNNLPYSPTRDQWKGSV